MIYFIEFGENEVNCNNAPLEVAYKMIVLTIHYYFKAGYDYNKS